MVCRSPDSFFVRTTSGVGGMWDSVESFLVWKDYVRRVSLVGVSTPCCRWDLTTMGVKEEDS